jgi:N utilization substance protein A
MGRIAAQAAKQVMMQRIREAEREMKYEEYAGREGGIVTGIMQQTDSPLHAARSRSGRGAAAPGRAGAPRASCPTRRPGEGLHRRGAQDRQGPPDRGQPHPPGPDQAPLRPGGARDRRRHRRDQGLRPRAGQRTKIAVWSNDPNIDPVGACVGARGARVRQVVNELRGEKIDIVPFSEDEIDFVAKALQPAKVKEVTSTATPAPPR